MIELPIYFYCERGKNMLKLENITKDYISGDSEVTALKGINLEFRKSEFVSILGQSGCGKTTLLNIIGGLDRYTTGDLSVNGVSTKKFKDRDWDTYRNHSIGFVFQNYNLIPHQTVLANVELALTLSGVSKKERKKRAKEALEKVGLGDQLNKKPNQMSGGQMQRVAIARALVNNPEILLADEPTGALDSNTSIQIMEILKEISKDKLVIMVTHNPELAEKYSTRIIKVLDGNVMDDSNPYDSSKEPEEKIKKVKAKKTYMNFFTALSLSLNNLMTKKARTILTAFAGSIGIIGIALILSLSNGVQNYINKVEQETLATYPITIQDTTIDETSMLEIMMGEGETEEHEDGKIYSSNMMGDMISSISAEAKENDMVGFKKFLDSNGKNIENYTNSIQYAYNLDLNLYKYDDENPVQVNPSTVLQNFNIDTSGIQYSMTNTSVFAEMMDNREFLESQYDLVAGSWPKAYNEVVVVVDKNNEILDYTLYTLGIKDQSKLQEMFANLMSGTEVEKAEVEEYEYDDIIGLTYKLILPTDYYQKENGVWVDKSLDEEYMKSVIANGTEIKIVGIIKENEETVVSTMSAGTVAYTSDLTKYYIDAINNSEIVKEQKANQEINVITGEAFDSINTYDATLKALGSVDLENPSTIYIYPKDFDSKEAIANIIEEYNNEQADESKKITYSDLVEVMISSVSTIIDTVSYVLIAFVAISLVVSSIMIGIITYISVLERTKEIGILRAIGASKKDISRVFNAETIIIGFTAGIIAIGVTCLLDLLISSIVKQSLDVSNIAVLPVGGAIILVAISVFLTFIAGLIPARVASKKDPVEALRTE
jgi:putative ABC transport system permease protein